MGLDWAGTGTEEGEEECGFSIRSIRFLPVLIFICAGSWVFPQYSCRVVFKFLPYFFFERDLWLRILFMY